MVVHYLCKSWWSITQVTCSYTPLMYLPKINWPKSTIIFSSDEPHSTSGKAMRKFHRPHHIFLSLSPSTSCLSSRLSVCLSVCPSTCLLVCLPGTLGLTGTLTRRCHSRGWRGLKLIKSSLKSLIEKCHTHHRVRGEMVEAVVVVIVVVVTA